MSIKKNSGFNRNRTFGIEIEGLSRFKPQRPGPEPGIVRDQVRLRGIQPPPPEALENRDRRLDLVKTREPLGSSWFRHRFGVLRAWKKSGRFVRRCNKIGCRVNRSCGLHVHHDASDYNVEAFKNLYAIYIRYEAAIDELVKRISSWPAEQVLQQPWRGIRSGAHQERPADGPTAL